MSIFDAFFNADKSIEKLTDAAINTGDMLVFTDEEKKQYKIKQEEQRIKWLKAYEPFKLAQRYIAVIVIIPYMVAWIITFVVSYYYEVGTQQMLLEGNISVVVWLIVAFYFGGGAAEGIIARFQNMFIKKK